MFVFTNKNDLLFNVPVFLILLKILLLIFHLHFWLLLSKRAHLKDSSAKKSISTENFWGVDAPLPPCSRRPDLSKSSSKAKMYLCCGGYCLLLKTYCNRFRCPFPLLSNRSNFYLVRFINTFTFSINVVLYNFSNEIGIFSYNTFNTFG